MITLELINPVLNLLIVLSIAQLLFISYSELSDFHPELETQQLDISVCHGN